MNRKRHPIVSWTLNGGVLVSCALLVLGLVESLLRPAGSGKPGVADIPSGLLAGEPAATVTAGLVVLMLTPLLRVVVLTLEFIRERDTPFAMISIGVLLLLAVTIAISFG